MNDKLNIYLVNVTIQFNRNRKVKELSYNRRVTKGNDFPTRLKFLRLKSFCKEFNPSTDKVTKIEIIKKVGETRVTNN